MAETSIPFADEESLEISRNLESKRRGATSKRVEFLGEELRSREIEGYILQPLAIIGTALASWIVGCIFDGEECTAIQKLVVFGVIFCGVVLLRLSSLNLKEQNRILNTILALEVESAKTYLNSKNFFSLISEALNEVGTLDQASQSFFKNEKNPLSSSFHIENEAMPLPNVPYTINLTKAEITNLLSKGLVSL